ncbi:MAG: ATP-dependent helicase [Candidatus Eremiobacteraeota bacterium]|nr:ATP-dependent helicase [Candidatus Eremiobacteraeota bacterium]
MITLDLDEDQRQAAEAPFEACVAIAGEPGSGKTYALQRRIALARERFPAAAPIVTGPSRRFDAIAFDVLAQAGIDVRRVDDPDASLLFARACEPLFALQWDEFSAAQLDPEIPGLRTPERFAESAFRLIRKLREANIAPDEFLSRSLRGATEFYAHPPNLANPALLAATKGIYHDSLDVTPHELQRQHRREVDLAKILAKLYEAYVELVRTTRLATGRDAVAEALEVLRAQPELAPALREKHRLAFVDDAEDLTPAELALLRGIFGESLSGVTLCGDPASAVSQVRLAAPDAAFATATTRIVLSRHHRAATVPLQLHRARTERDEAAFVARHVAEWIAGGTPPDRIAILFRSVAGVEPFERALLELDIPAVVEGDANVFADRRALDALALLWNVYDPFRHDWLLRTLSGRALRLSDASLATLCAEPPNPQAPLFIVEDGPAPTTRPSRWDPKRDLRLGWNVVRGEQDAALSETARERLKSFRERRRRWMELAAAGSFDVFARTVWREGLAREGAPGSARARAQQIVLERLLARLHAFFAERPGATLGDALAYAESREATELESCEAYDGDGFVRLCSVEAARGREFDFVAIAGAAAGTFPRWYSPDAFLFSPRLGMIPKENAGEGRASRTAKFSFYVHRNRARESYNAGERRAFTYALRRARRGALVTAWGSPTRGATAPEFLEELRAARLPGTELL